MKSFLNLKLLAFLLSYRNMCKLQDSFKSAKCSVVNICVVLNSQLPFPALELILEACAGRAEHMAGLDPLCSNHGTPNDNSDL